MGRGGRSHQVPRGIASADFNADGKADVAANWSFLQQVVVYDTVPPADPIVHSLAAPSPLALASGDFNGDGAWDLVIGHWNPLSCDFFADIYACPPT